jgi:hypothetical protein
MAARTLLGNWLHTNVVQCMTTCMRGRHGLHKKAAKVLKCQKKADMMLYLDTVHQLVRRYFTYVYPRYQFPYGY